MNKFFIIILQVLVPFISIAGAYALPPRGYHQGYSQHQQGYYHNQQQPYNQGYYNQQPYDSRGTVIYSNPYYPYGSFYYPPNQDIDPDETEFKSIYEENRRTIGQ